MASKQDSGTLGLDTALEAATTAVARAAAARAAARVEEARAVARAVAAKAVAREVTRAVAAKAVAREVARAAEAMGEVRGVAARGAARVVYWEALVVCWVEKQMAHAIVCWKTFAKMRQCRFCKRLRRN